MVRTIRASSREDKCTDLANFSGETEDTGMKATIKTTLGMALEGTTTTRISMMWATGQVEG